jgi:DNA-binding CsgD family transcriptional regulator
MYSSSSKIVIENTINLPEHFNYLKRLPGLMLVKNLHSEFCAMSNQFAHLIGFNDAVRYEGISEYDVPCGTQNIADMYIRNDQRVMTTGNESLCVIIGDYSIGRTVLISKTKPVYDKSDNIVGVFAHTKDVTNSHVFARIMNSISSDFKKAVESNFQIIYTLNQHKLPDSITPRQKECLFLMARGKSVKEIAWIMKISNRTVENHIAALKVSLDCATWSQIIEKAQNHDFLSFINESFLI